MRPPRRRCDRRGFREGLRECDMVDRPVQTHDLAASNASSQPKRIFSKQIFPFSSKAECHTDATSSFSLVLSASLSPQR